MKNLNLLIALMLLSCSGIFAQNINTELSFNDKFIKTSDLIIEGTVTQISYFKDTSYVVKHHFFEQCTADSDGVWFVQYRVLVHKIFKGQLKINTITVVSTNYSENSIEVNGKKIKPQYYHWSIPQYSNYYIGRTGMFFLKTKFDVKIKTAPLYAYYLKDEHMGLALGSYEEIKELTLFVREENKKITFDSLEQLYTYIESYTKQKRKNISYTQYELLSSFDKVENYINKYFSDSIDNESFASKLRFGRITQINKDQYICNKSRFKYQPQKSDSNNARYDTGNRSIKRFNNVIKKTGALYKSGSTITYNFNKESAKYIKTNNEVFFVFEIQFKADISKYLYEANVALSYNTQVFGSNIANATGEILTVERGDFLDVNNYPNAYFQVTNINSNTILIPPQSLASR